REHNYPTGLSLTPIDPALPNIAIPHTESTFVRTTRIIPIKLKQSLSFHNMIIPDETLSVSFLFMILNENGIEQTGLLATIMDFINTTDRSSLLAFFQCEDKEEVYRFLQKNFKGEI
ncbi:TPA: PTS sugar transporter subunit IIA, partial [Enterococcus faecalis]|nr:PTS sugar transporter subunit IIA [Enterococcus faecalis]